MAASAEAMMCGGVAKSGSPISRCTTSVPCCSRSLALARTSNADSVPSWDMRCAHRIVRPILPAPPKADPNTSPAAPEYRAVLHSSSEEKYEVPDARPRRRDGRRRGQADRQRFHVPGGHHKRVRQPIVQPGADEGAVLDGDPRSAQERLSFQHRGTAHLVQHPPPPPSRPKPHPPSPRPA